jgi:hypothetical protein
MHLDAGGMQNSVFYANSGISQIFSLILPLFLANVRQVEEPNPQVDIREQNHG